MKRYKVTSEHLMLKEGLIINYNEDGGFHFIREGDFTLDVDRIVIQMYKGWIEEIPELEIQAPEFTRQDMIEFVDMVSDLKVTTKDLDNFIKDKSKQ